MKKILVILGFLMLLFACGGNSNIIEFNESEMLIDSEAKSALKNPSENKGVSVELSGYVFNIIEEDSNYVYTQVYQDFENYKDDVVLKIPKTVLSSLESDSFILAQGVILGEMKGENLLGADLKLATVEVDNIYVGKYEETVARAIKEFVINEKQSQHGQTITIEKIEFSDYDTRLFINIKNDGDYKVSTYTFDFSMIINGRNYTHEYSFYADYPELDSELNPNTYTDGILGFKKLDFNEINEIKIIVDRPYSDNWEIDFEDYIFEITLK